LALQVRRAQSGRQDRLARKARLALRVLQDLRVRLDRLDRPDRQVLPARLELLGSTSAGRGSAARVTPSTTP